MSFTYPGMEKETLHNVSLRIPAGKVVAIVGENGSGKSTLIKLLCRLYDPTSGTIKADGTDLREFSSAQLRRQIGILFQDFAKYNLTVRDNIRFGDIDAEIEGEQIEEAARASGIDADIRRLDRGYDAILGRYFQDGVELSIGQWQKIALARAFLRRAQIVALDEPTSAMDPNAEHDFFKRFQELAKGKTAIIISHRFSSIKMADYIYVMSGGRIAESGTHDELMRLNGLYHRLFEKQAAFYR